MFDVRRRLILTIFIFIRTTKFLNIKISVKGSLILNLFINYIYGINRFPKNVPVSTPFRVNCNNLNYIYENIFV